MPLHPLIDAAARGAPPPWMQAGPRRFAHMQRVSALMSDWAAALQLADVERARWRALGLLHDVLRQAPPEQLRPLVPPALRDIEAKLLHGPAAAARLRSEGVADPALLEAIAHHTLGSPSLDRMGRALFLADFLEPARRYGPLLLATLRARMPHRLEHVLIDVLRFRVQRMLDNGRPIHDATAAFWNSAVTAYDVGTQPR